MAANVWGQKNFNKQNFAEMYDFNRTKLHPLFQCYHEKDSSSTIFYQIDYSELTYAMKYDSSYFAQAKIHYEIYYNYKAKDLLDSGSVYLFDQANFNKDNSSLGSFEVPMSYRNKYLLLLEVTDLNGDYSVKILLDVDKYDKLSRQNFYIRGEDQLPFLQSYINRNKIFQIISQKNEYPIINIRYFKPNQSIAKLPMEGIKKVDRIVKADTILKIPMKAGYSNILQLEDQGYYHFSFDSTDQSGFTIFQFTSDYPYVTSPMQMVMPLRYITSKAEFKALFESEDKKKAVDDFWIKISGNKERAKNMIKLYYNRVQSANQYFVSDKEGWMTDRGMIYIVFGAPDIVYRDGTMETWKYGLQQASKSITFNFYRIENPFTNNDYWIDRSTNYTGPWNNAIEIWRR